MTSAAAFLGGASTRLLPASLPLRYFGAAIVYHLLGWIALLASAGDVVAFAGGLGWPLAALHLFTLGVLAMTAMGAAAQLMPVATRQPAIGPRWLAVIWWVYTPGVLVLVLGMGFALPALLALGAAAVTLSLAAWAVLVVRHLLGARGMPGLRLHAWAGLVSLAVLVVTALLLVSLWIGRPLADRSVLLSLHLLAGPFGFMGLLVLGLSCVLVPLFALSEAPGDRAQLVAGALAIAALVCAAVVAYALALVLGAAALALHVRMMLRSLRDGMRKELGRSMLLVKIGWGCLAACIVGFAIGWPPAALGLLLVGGWLLSALFGMLQRILPFLGAMHAPPQRRRAPTPSSLTHEPSLRMHFACHLVALGVSFAALLLASRELLIVGATVGAAGALAFAAFYIHLLQRIRDTP